MSLCNTCQKDSKNHTKMLWQEHQKTLCTFCQKPQSAHSQKLWEMHTDTVHKAVGRGKMWYVQIGHGRKVPAKVVEWNGVPPYDKELIPIYMHCKECKLAMSEAEEDLADVFDGICLKCFCEMTDQEHHCTTSKSNQEVRT